MARKRLIAHLAMSNIQFIPSSIRTSIEWRNGDRLKVSASVKSRKGALLVLASRHHDDRYSQLRKFVRINGFVQLVAHKIFDNEGNLVRVESFCRASLVNSVFDNSQWGSSYVYLVNRQNDYELNIDSNTELNFSTVVFKRKIKTSEYRHNLYEYCTRIGISQTKCNQHRSTYTSEEAGIAVSCMRDLPVLTKTVYRSCLSSAWRGHTSIEKNIVYACVHSERGYRDCRRSVLAISYQDKMRVHSCLQKVKDYDRCFVQ